LNKKNETKEFSMLKLAAPAWRLIGTVLVVLLVLILIQPVSPVEAQSGVVQAVMFWENGCPHCELVLSETIPGLQSKYAEKLQIDLIEVVSVEDVNRLYSVGQAYGLAKEQVGVPMLIIGDNILVGSKQIPEELPGLIDGYLASGGIQTVLRQTVLQAGETSGQTEVQAVEDAPRSNGIWLAWVTIAVLLVGLLLAGWQLTVALQGKQTLHLPAWTEWLVPLLAVAGSGVAIYLTFIETTKAKAICGPVGDCNAVQNSPYALIFGLIPVGLVGLLGYLAILAAWFWYRYRRDALAEFVPIALLGMTLIGVVYSIYLTYLEIFVIHAVCIWCISSAWIMLLLMLLSLPAAASWVVGSGADEVEEEA